MPLRDVSERYRPLTERLRGARRRDRVAHAYLVTGDDEQRLLELARAWAAACACRRPAADGDACGECEVCRRLANDTYEQLYVLRPESKSRRITVENVRDLEHSLYLRSAGRLKIGLIEHADRMNPEAQNAFLKTLEEPAPGTLLLLLTLNPAALLPTIISRCQRLNLLDNRTAYDLPQLPALCAHLAALAPGAGALAATAAAEGIVAILKELRDNGQSAGNAFLAAYKDGGHWGELEAPARRRLEAQADAAASAAYLADREKAFSALHTWFAQEYLRAQGVDTALCPNPELYGEKAPPPPPPAATARENLRHVEQTLENLTYNVDEELAIHELCQRLCRKG